MRTVRQISFAVIACISLIACKSEDKKAEAETEMREPKLKEENISYTGDSVSMNGFVVFDENKEGARPAVMVVHEWWGLNDYPRSRARQLAELGYMVMALDLYGNGKIADNPDSAQAYAMPFYMDPEKTRRRFDAALAKLKSYSQTDSTKMAAIGYCFGGTQVLNMAKMGVDLDGVVSFHGNLFGVAADKNKLKAKVLVCHGADDSFVPRDEITQFKKQMDSIGATYTFKSYPGAVHAFTNPYATATGEKFKMNIRYNAAADSASWKDMKEFFSTIF